MCIIFPSPCYFSSSAAAAAAAALAIVIFLDNIASNGSNGSNQSQSKWAMSPQYWSDCRADGRYWYVSLLLPMFLYLCNCAAAIAADEFVWERERENGDVAEEDKEDTQQCLTICHSDHIRTFTVHSPLSTEFLKCLSVGAHHPAIDQWPSSGSSSSQHTAWVCFINPVLLNWPPLPAAAANRRSGCYLGDYCPASVPKTANVWLILICWLCLLKSQPHT